jgi:hypothetical protein
MGRHKIALENIVHTRRYLSGLINRVEEGRIDSKEAGKLTYICNTLLKAQELEVIEKRLLRLEEAAELKGALNVTPKPKMIEEKEL